jgi:hypothetical protein
MITNEQVRLVFDALELELPDPIPDWVVQACRVLLDDVKPVRGSFVLSDAQREALGIRKPAEARYEEPRPLVERDFGHIGAPVEEGKRPPPGAKRTHCILCGADFYDDARPNETRMLLRCPECHGTWYE